MGRWMRERGPTYLVGFFLGLGLYCLGKMSAETKIHDPRPSGLVRAGIWVEETWTEKGPMLKVIKVAPKSRAAGCGLRSGDLIWGFGYESRKHLQTFYGSGLSLESGLNEALIRFEEEPGLLRGRFGVLRGEETVDLEFATALFKGD